MSAPWVYFPSFFLPDTYVASCAAGRTAAAAMLLQSAWRRHKARATHASLVAAAAAKLQRATRRHLQGRTGCSTWVLPLTTLVLERVSPSRMNWKKKSPATRQEAGSSRVGCQTKPSLAGKITIAVVTAALVCSHTQTHMRGSQALHMHAAPHSTYPSLATEHAHTAASHNTPR